MPLELALGERHNIVYQLVQIELDALSIVPLQRSANALDDSATAFAIAYDTSQRCFNFRDIGWLPVEPAQTRIGIVDDAREWLIDLVGD